MQAQNDAAFRGVLLIGRVGLLPDDAIVINTARAGVIAEPALRWAVLHSTLRFGLDVFHLKPPDPEDPIVSSPHVVATPHSANEVGEDQYEAMWNVAYENIVRYLDGRVGNRICSQPARHAADGARRAGSFRID